MLATSAARGPGVLTPRRGLKPDKMITGAIAATLSSTVIIGVFHLIVVKIPLPIALGTIGGAGFSGIFAALEGKESEGNVAAYGTLIGVVLGCFGAYYAKTSAEPWRK